MLETKERNGISKENKTEESRREDADPSLDGGWGWVVCFAVFCLNFGVAGTGTSNGIILLGLVDLYGESLSKAAMVGSLYIGSLLSAGPLVMIVMTFQANHRQVIISGGIIACISTIASVFAPRLELLYFTYGIITGGSVGMSYFAANTILASYFKKKRSLAVGIAFCGGGCGVFVLNYLIEKSISYYGMRGTFLLLSGLFLNFAVQGALCRPLESSKKVKNHCKEMKKTPKTNLGFEAEVTITKSEDTPTVCDVHIHSGIIADRFQEKRLSVVSERVTTRCKNIFFTLFDPMVFKNHGLQLLLIIYFIWSAGEVLPIFLPANVVDAGLTREEGALIMSIYGIAFATGQLFVGIIADLLHVPISYILTFSMLILSTTSIAIPSCHTFFAFAFCTSLFGIFHGFSTALRVVLSASTVGIENLDKSYSPVCLLIGVGYILFPLMAGSLYDATRSFGTIFYYIGGSLFFGLISSTGIIYLQLKGKFVE